MNGFKALFLWSGVLSVFVAGIELWLIYYLGRLIDDLVTTGPADFWQVHAVELVLVTIFILFARPLIQALDTALINNSIMPNVGTTVRWRSHRRVRQSVSWFENDFAAASPTHHADALRVGEATFQAFDAMAWRAGVSSAPCC